jgi:diguanylate cyclase (GGDEF)-like protein
MDFIGTETKFGLKKGLILAAALLLAAAAGYVDLVVDKIIGDDISFNIFFLLPVGIAAWFVGLRSGILVSVISAISCYLADTVFTGIKHENTAVPIWNSTAGLVFFLLLAFLLYILRRELGIHRTLAMEDFLTKASNSRAFYNYARIEVARIKRDKKPLTIVYLDIDNFKQINDTYGHNVGDEVLVAFVNAVRKNIRATDAVGRLGGDEFAILLPEMGAAGVGPFIEKLRKIISTEMSGKGWILNYSAGVLTCTRPPDSVNEMIRMADDAMYEVKKQGKNGVKYITCE